MKLHIPFLFFSITDLRLMSYGWTPENTAKVTGSCSGSFWKNHG